MKHKIKLIMFFFSSFVCNFIISVSKGEKNLKVDLICIFERYGYPYKISEPIFQFAMCISLFKGTDQRKYLPYFLTKPRRYFIKNVSSFTSNFYVK